MPNPSKTAASVNTSSVRSNNGCRKESLFWLHTSNEASQIPQCRPIQKEYKNRKKERNSLYGIQNPYPFPITHIVSKLFSGIVGWENEVVLKDWTLKLQTVQPIMQRCHMSPCGTYDEQAEQSDVLKFFDHPCTYLNFFMEVPPIKRVC